MARAWRVLGYLVLVHLGPEYIQDVSFGASTTRKLAGSY